MYLNCTFGDIYIADAFTTAPYDPGLLPVDIVLPLVHSSILHRAYAFRPGGKYV